MHEYSLVASLLTQVEAICREHDADRVLDVHVSVGELAGVEPELFKDAFDVQTNERWNFPAALTMNVIPLEAKCGQCKRVFHVERFQFQCVHCHASDLKVLRGEDVILENVTLEQTTPQPEQLNEQSS